MNISFYDELVKTLMSKPEYVSSDNTLLKNKVYEDAMKQDGELLDLLFNNESVRSILFSKVGNNYVFDKVEFGWILNNKEFLPDSFTMFKNKIGLGSEKNQFINITNDVVINFPYKDSILVGNQTNEDSKKEDEIFYNEVLTSDRIDTLLAPKVFENFYRYKNGKENTVDKIKEDDNLIIKGNNLYVISSLLRKYENKVKLIYIDPPYNTGGATDTFSYNNTFKHSTWLTFMKNRLDVAKRLLKNDGFICLTIDHVELFYIGCLMDEIFGRDNRVGIVNIYINPKGRQHEKFFSASTEYMLVYAKDIGNAKFNNVAIDETKSAEFNLEDDAGKKYRLLPFARVRTSTKREAKPDFYYPIYVSKDLKEITLDKKDNYYEVFPIVNGIEYTWKTIPKTFKERNVNNFYQAVMEDGKVQIYHKYEEQQVFKNIWINKKYFPEFQGTNLLKKILGDNLFSYPKSLYAVMDTCKIMTSEDDIVLDFFAGSGTTAHAIEELNNEDGGNRKYIIVEQLDYIKNVTVERMKHVSDEKNSSFVYCELKALNHKYVDMIINENNSKKLLDIWNLMKKEAFICSEVSISEMDKHIEDFETLTINEQKNILLGILDKNMLYVNYSDIEDEDFGVPKEDIEINNSFYEEDSNE